MILNLVLFETMLVIGYIYYRFIANKFNFRKKEKEFDRHKKDLVDLMIYGSIIYLLNGNSYFNVYYFILFFINCVPIMQLHLYY